VGVGRRKKSPLLSPDAQNNPIETSEEIQTRVRGDRTFHVCERKPSLFNFTLTLVLVLNNTRRTGEGGGEEGKRESPGISTSMNFRFLRSQKKENFI